MLQCPRCRACSASHMPRPEYLLAYYQTYYEGKDHKVTFAGIGHLARHILQSTGSASLSGLVRILDFGGGDGSLALAIAEQLLAWDPGRQVEILLVDYQAPASSTTGRISVTHQTDLELIGGQYELVLASAILEHIPEAHPVLRRLLDSVAPAGYFYARTPCVVPLARIFRYVDLTYPAHVHDLGGAFWNRAARIFGFEGRYLVSGPSPVATRLLADPFRTVAAYLCKLPARLEGLVSPAGRKNRLWSLTGGWEVVLQRG